MKVLAAIHPLRSDHVNITVPVGTTLSDILAEVQPDAMLRSSAHIYIDQHYIPRENWPRVRPKNGATIYVRAFVPPQGGDQGKDLLRNVLIIGVAVAALALGGPLGGAIFPFLGAGVGGALAQMAIGVGGMLLVNALVPPRTTSDPAADSPTKFIESARNTADPFGVVPVLFGTTKIVPKYAAEPITEIVGDDQYLRMLFLWGVGPLDITNFKIGETDLADFTDVEIEHRYGYDTDTPVTLYPSVVDQQNFEITLSEADGYTIRTSDDNADEVGVEFVFPDGLITVNSDGSRASASVAIELEYSVAGANSWQNIPTAGGARTFDDSWTNISAGAFNQVTFTHQLTNAIRHGITWKVPTRGQFDVRIKRLTADSTVDTVRDIIEWVTLRRVTNESPINSPVPVALTALRIKATDQLSNVIDEFSGYASSVCPDWDSGSSTWITRATKNPASLYRYGLQNNGLQVPYDDSSIDLTMMEYWHEYCDTQGFEFNQNRDFQASVWEMLADIAASGRASPQMVNGKYSVVIDEAKNPVSHVTPRNSLNFKASKVFVDTPHAFRVQFNNEEKDYANDEVRVYLPGYDTTNATKFETISFPGVTSPDLVTKHARFNELVAIQRPETWEFTQDMEVLAYNRGDVVLITHDVLLVGLAFGRIKSVTLDGSSNCTAITVDEMLTMEIGNAYGVSIRTVADAAVTASLVNVPGDQHTVMFVSAIPAASAPSPGDLFGFGILGAETDKALVIAITPQSDFSADVVAVPYRTEVYDGDADALPPFVSNLTPVETTPDVVIEQVRSDETVLTVGPGNSLVVHINVKVQPVTNMGATLQVQSRPSLTNERFINAEVDSYVGNEVSIGNVRTGEYVDVRVRWVIQGLLVPGAWNTIFNHRVVGKSTPPNALQNMTISTFGGQAFIRWDTPAELDVIFGGEVQFRHSADPSPVWGNSTSIGDSAHARTLFATLPLKPGAYLARVFDDSGNQSDVVTTNTKQASVLEFAPVTDVDEGSAFSGDMSDVQSDGTYLSLAGGLFDDITDVDAIPSIDTALAGAPAPTVGTYLFASGFDFTTVKRVRLTTRITSFNAGVNDDIDSWDGNIDDRTDFDGTDTADCDCIIYVRMTDTDPAASPTWTDWQRLDSMEVNCRGCQFKAMLYSNNTDFNIFVSELGVDAEEIV